MCVYHFTDGFSAKQNDLDQLAEMRFLNTCHQKHKDLKCFYYNY